MNTRDNQTVFNHICKTFIRDERPACYDDHLHACVYSPQTEDQVGCTVGCCLSLEDAKKWDETLHTSFDGSSILDVAEGYPELYGDYFDEDQKEFLSDLQNFHDRYIHLIPYTKEQKAQKLVEIAEQHGLTVYKYVRDLANKSTVGV